MVEYVINEKERKETWKLAKDRACNLSGSHRIGLLVDYPNLYMHGKENGEYFDGRVLLKMASQYGQVVTSKIYTTLQVRERLPGDLLKFERMGYEIVIRPISKDATNNSKDIDALLITDVLCLLYESDIDVIIIASDDSDYVPAMRQIKKKGKIGVAFVCTIDGSRSIVNASTTADLIPFVKQPFISDVNLNKVLELSEEVN